MNRKDELPTDEARDDVRDRDRDRIPDDHDAAEAAKDVFDAFKTDFTDDAGHDPAAPRPPNAKR